jgi:class 3 adenylate cyclase
MFSDLVGSTALSARMDPEDLREIISAYQKCVAETVRRFGGFVYLPAHDFWLLALVNLSQAALLAPLVPLADALPLSWSRSTTRRNSGAFEYGWVRGIGSAAFVAGVLVAGQSAAVWGLTFSSLPHSRGTFRSLRDPVLTSQRGSPRPGR